MTEEIIIIGAGPAGLSAAIYAAREDFHPVIISGFLTGGQLLLTSKVENYPAFPEGIEGPDLMQLMKRQAERFGARFVYEEATEVDLDSKPFRVVTGSGNFESRVLIIATGASPQWLGIDSEKKFIGKGVSACATCDAPFFKGKKVMVVGGGDTAMEDSLFLTKFADRVTIIHRRDRFRASRILQNKVLKNEKIDIIWNSEIDEILGKNTVNAVTIRDVNTGQKKELPSGGVFIAIGHRPNTAFLEGKLPLDEKGYVKTIDEVRTHIDGLYIAGDVADGVYRQAVTAAASGVKAALEARTYLQKIRIG